MIISFNFVHFESSWRVWLNSKFHGFLEVYRIQENRGCQLKICQYKWLNRRHDRCLSNSIWINKIIWRTLYTGNAKLKFYVSTFKVWKINLFKKMVHLQYRESNELKLKSLNILSILLYVHTKKRDLSGFHWRAIGQRRVW